MSEDFFDSIWPPVKMSMIEQPQQTAAVKDEDVLRQEDGEDMMADGVKQDIGWSGGQDEQHRFREVVGGDLHERR